MGDTVTWDKGAQALQEGSTIAPQDQGFRATFIFERGVLPCEAYLGTVAPPSFERELQLACKRSLPGARSRLGNCVKDLGGSAPLNVPA